MVMAEGRDIGSDQPLQVLFLHIVLKGPGVPARAGELAGQAGCGHDPYSGWRSIFRLR